MTKSIIILSVLSIAISFTLFTACSNSNKQADTTTLKINKWLYYFKKIIQQLEF